MSGEDKATRDATRLTAYHCHILSVGHRWPMIGAAAQANTLTREERIAIAGLAKLMLSHTEVVARVAREYVPQGELGI